MGIATRRLHRGDRGWPVRTASAPRARSTWAARPTRSSGSTPSPGRAWTSASLPYSLKVLLENLLRTEDGANITADHIRALAGWDADAEPDKEIQFTPARVLMQDFTGVPCVVDLATMREAMADLGGDADQDQPARPGRAGHRPLGHRRRLRHARRVRAQRRDRVRAQPGALPVPALGPDRVQRLQGRAARHRHRAPGQHRAPGPRGLHPRDRRRADGLPGHLRRHRLAHHDGQRPRRGGLGRRRHRGRGRDARPAGVDADPAGGRLQAHRRPARGRHRHRPGADHHRDAAQARRGREVRGVLRRRRLGAAAGQPGHHRQHEPGVRLDHRDLPDRRGDDRLPRAHRPLAPSRSRWSRRTPRSRASGTTRTPSRATPSSSSWTCRPSCRPSPARSARRTGSPCPTPRRRSAPRWPTTSTSR